MELRRIKGRPANPGSPGKMAVKMEYMCGALVERKPPSRYC